MKHEMELGEFAALLSGRQLEQLDRFAAWLRAEAADAGGIGPAESRMLDARHLFDSLAFSLAFSEPPVEVFDLGTGVGLPGIPLAILWDQALVRLIDRSGRRVDLAERAVKVLGLDNVEVRRTDLVRDPPMIDRFVARAVFPPHVWAGVAENVLNPGGFGVVATTREAVVPESTDRLTIKRLDFQPEMLDRPVSFLMITACD